MFNPVGSIPTLKVAAITLPGAWERSLLSLWDSGQRIRTQYDRKDANGEFIDPPSIDATLTFTVLEPEFEPRFHRCFPGGPADLQEYRMEVVEGIKDHWVDPNDKAKWQYTYHGRLTKYPLFGTQPGADGGACFGHIGFIDQLEKMADQLAKSPYSRRVQATTWQPWVDQDCSDPPCLERIWCRIMFDEAGEWYLNMNVYFRSRDAYKAAFMNADAFICLQRWLADRIGEKAGRHVCLGRYCDTSDSYHIYGKDIEQFKNEFLANHEKRKFGERTWRTEEILPMMEEAISEILAKVKRQDENK